MNDYENIKWGTRGKLILKHWIGDESTQIELIARGNFSIKVLDQKEFDKKNNGADDMAIVHNHFNTLFSSYVSEKNSLKNNYDKILSTDDSKVLVDNINKKLAEVFDEHSYIFTEINVESVNLDEASINNIKKLENGKSEKIESNTQSQQIVSSNENVQAKNEKDNKAFIIVGIILLLIVVIVLVKKIKK